MAIFFISLYFEFDILIYGWFNSGQKVLMWKLSPGFQFSFSNFLPSFSSDVDVPSPDEKSVITYVSSIYDAFPKIPEGGEGIAANVCHILLYNMFYRATIFKFKLIIDGCCIFLFWLKLYSFSSHASSVKIVTLLLLYCSAKQIIYLYSSFVNVASPVVHF